MASSRWETPLAKIVKSRIRRERLLTFHEFMTMALYHPLHGFYSRGPRIGQNDGPFHTNANFPAFAFSLAQCLIQAQERLGEPMRVVELGAGTGQLAERLLSWLPPVLHNYVIVEPSEGLRAQQILRGLHVVSTLSELPAAPTVVFGNEVLDALPFHRVMGDGHGSILELFVAVDGKGEFVELPEHPSTPFLAQHLSGMGVTLGRGQVAEVNLDLAVLLGEVARVVSKGYVFFIDYGEDAQTLYGYTRRNGTLRCFKNQREVFDPFDCVGEQDLTADVNWTALEQSLEATNFVKVGLVAQGIWLKNLGIDRYPEVCPDAVNAVEEITCLTKRLTTWQYL